MTGAISLEALAEYIQDAFKDVHMDTSTPDLFFFAGDERKHPFATIVTRDTEFDHHSELDRDEVFRLNLGLSKESFQKLFPQLDPNVDYTDLDVLLPHPAYSRMFWLSVLNPSHETLRLLRPYLKEAHSIQVNRAARG
ncbi:DUF6194 family protein [Corallococcus exiguus]|uniref:DUF6194 domain-containing protein n=1 Tax=Corallococcus exiguus TaxID=83462 RepID=A0A7X4YBM5_9BACT|nr:DUF6194 family protein [Corallococcus exiguus]NBC42488.1 hypothetical protein [Corallococcus exiguus]TNV56922.1 hypothetical protein FH620_29610 [Corallococcus exiguus]